jgi:hypothetical protein
MLPHSLPCSSIHAMLLLTIPLFGGCGPFVFPISFAATTSGQLPASGPAVVVVVTDDRGGDSPTWLGVIRAGGVVGDYVLDGGDPLARRVAGDVIASLRSQGYRADLARPQTANAEDTVLTIRIVRFAVQAEAPAFKSVAWRASWAFVCRSSVATSPRPPWLEVVYGMRQESLSTRSRKEAQDAIEAFYRAAIDDLVTHFRTAVTP